METTTFPDFLKLNNPADLRSEFHRIANILCNYYLISANSNEYDIIEVEFYHYSENHRDKFIYKRINGTEIKQNLSIGNWLFHYSGIDLTFGQTGTRGGILVRGIKDQERKIVGPLKTMLELLNHMTSVEQDGELKLKLVKRSNPTNFKVNSSARVGLNSKEEGSGELYRFRMEC